MAPAEIMTHGPMESSKMTPYEYINLRQKLGLTTEQLAEELGVGLRTAFRYESGDRLYVPKTPARLLEMLVRHGVPRHWNY